MKLFTAIMTTVLAVTGCATGPKPPTFKRNYTAIDAKDFKYEDKSISFTYIPETFASGVPVTFVNKTDKPVKIIWDETTFINPSGQSERVIHEGVRLLDKNAQIPPSMIPPKANLADSITPASRVFWSDTFWDYQPICGQKNLIPFKGFEQKDEECIGKVFGIFVTYELEGKKSSFTVKYRMQGRIQNEVSLK